MTSILCEGDSVLFRITPTDPNSPSLFEMSLDSGCSWQSISMRRSLRSWFKTRLAADWPPHHVVSAHYVNGALEIEHEDHLIIDELPLLESLRESRWRARFEQGRWSLERVRYLEDWQEWIDRWKNK